MTNAVTPLEKSKEILFSMATDEFRKEISALIRSKTSLIYISTTEEKRVLEFFKHYSIAGAYEETVWDCYNGFMKPKDDPKELEIVNSELITPELALDFIIKEEYDEYSSSMKKTKGNIYILLDFHRFLKDCTPELERRLRTFVRINTNSIIIMTGPQYESTEALDKEIRFFDFPLPNDNELKKALNSVVDIVAKSVPSIKQKIKDKEEEIINASAGLTYPEATTSYGKSLCMHRDILISSVLKEKQEIIKKTGLLEFSQPDLTLDDVGGLENLIEFLKERKNCFSKEARNFGVPVPKGVLLTGVPGGGKSLCAKAVSTYYDIPLLRLDFGSLFGSYVGESEGRLRRVLKIVERVSPCCLFVDEVEKGLSGSKSSGTNDSGVTSRVLGTLLTWMQEKKEPVFLVFTANQVESIPAEFLRAGRLDEIFFVDLPTEYERRLITGKLIKRKKRNPEDFDLGAIASASKDYTGAEIEKAIDMGIMVSFNESKRKLTTEDIVSSLKKFKSLKATRPEVIEGMQLWAVGKCIRANSDGKVQSKVFESTKQINIDSNEL